MAMIPANYRRLSKRGKHGMIFCQGGAINGKGIVRLILES